MAFPWLVFENFEDGTIGSGAVETDTVAQLDVAHYKTLANYPWRVAPFTGAYSVRLVLSGGTADAFLKFAAVDIADAATAYLKFDIWFSPNFTGTADDTCSLLELQGAASAITGSVGFRVVAATGDINIGIGSAASAAVPASFAAQAIERGRWHTIELKFVDQTNGTGTADLYVTRSGDPTQIAAQVSLTAKTNIVVTDGVIGIQDQLATTTGVILIDNFMMDDARIYPAPRYEIHQIFTKSGHAFVGPGWIAGAAIVDGTSPTMILFDTDVADVTSSQSYEISLATTATNQSSIGGAIYFQNGCYVQLGGTNPIGQVLLARADLSIKGVRGPLYFSDPGIKRLARGG